MTSFTSLTLAALLLAPLASLHAAGLTTLFQEPLAKSKFQAAI